MSLRLLPYLLKNVKGDDFGVPKSPSNYVMHSSLVSGRGVRVLRFGMPKSSPKCKYLAL